MDNREKLNALVREAESSLRPLFEEIDQRAYLNTERILASFRQNRVSEACFNPTTGYGYNDSGREKLERIYAEVFETEAALVRMQIFSGTHALTIGLFGLLRPGDIMLSVTGRPYDTLEEVIGIGKAQGQGSLKDFGIEYREVPLSPEGSPDMAAVERGIRSAGQKLKMVFIQRSKGYLNRKTLSVSEIGELVQMVRRIKPDTFVVVDNCYGEFVEEHEPTSVGADLCIGSLIKNPGGGMAETGGYLCGTEKAVELVSYRLTSPGTGGETGATLGQNKNMFKGLFYAPHTVAQALKTAHLAAYVCESLGLSVEPKWDERRYDIIQAISTLSREAMQSFCRGLQAGSPVDSFATPVPEPMPGYADEVIMAAGAFTSGSSIELSADGPIRPPYTLYLQGGLTYESGKYGILSAISAMLEDGIVTFR